MSQFNEPLKIEIIGEAIIVEPYVPDTKSEKELKKSGMVVVDKPDPKNRMWEDSTNRHKVSDFDEHPFQGTIKQISPLLKEKYEKIGSLEINDRIAFRVGSGEPIIYKGKVYWRVAPHEILFKYLGSER
jgi:hypothetical protein